MLTRSPTTTAHIPVRPPHVLVPIIADGLKQVTQNIAEIGKAMAEAGGQMSHAELLVWSEKNFRLKRTQTNYYLQIGRSAGGGPTVGSVKEHRRNRKKSKKVKKGNGASYAVLSGSLSSSEYQMGIDLVEAGFRALAKTLHPDKGGSQSAMTTLNKVRSRLKTLWR